MKELEQLFEYSEQILKLQKLKTKEYKEVLHILRDETSKKYKVVPLDDKYVLIKEK